MSGHTKGPWTVTSPWSGFSSIHGDDGGLVFGLAAGGFDEARPADECEANARLIAAAPDGLVFAEAHDAYMLETGYSGPDDAALHPKAAENWRQCRAFIARATEAQP